MDAPWLPTCADSTSRDPRLCGDTGNMAATRDVPSEMPDAGLLSIGERFDNEADRRCEAGGFAATAADIILG